MFESILRSRTATRCALVFALAGAALTFHAAMSAERADAAGFSCWVQGAYLYGNSGYGYRAVCNMPSDLHVTLKRNGVPIAAGVSTLNVSPGPGNFVNTGVQGVPLACRVNYQVVVTAYPQGGGAGMVWSTGVPRPVC